MRKRGHANHVISVCVILILLLTAVCSGCSTSVSQQAPTAPPPKTTDTPPPAENAEKLVIGSFSGDGQAQALAFADANPHIEVEFIHVPSGGIDEQGLDVLIADSSSFRAYVESGTFADLSALMPLAKQLGTYPFVLDAATHDGIIRAFAWEIHPGLVFYRRSLAIEYFGTDDPSVIQTLMDDMDKFEQMAAIIKDKSGKDTYMIPSIDSLIGPYLAGRNKPWIVDDQIVIDPQINALFEAGRTFRRSGYDAQVGNPPSQQWYDSISDKLTDENGYPKQVFCFFLSSGMLSDALISHCGETAGDWACVPGPLPFAQPVSFAGVINGCDNPENAMEFIRFSALNADGITDWAAGTYTQYLNQADTDDTAFQNSIRFVSSRAVAEQIAKTGGDAETNRFLGGQNAYGAFTQAAPHIRLMAWRAFDAYIESTHSNMLSSALEEFSSGRETLEEAIM